MATYFHAALGHDTGESHWVVGKGGLGQQVLVRPEEVEGGERGILRLEKARQRGRDGGLTGHGTVDAQTLLDAGLQIGELLSIRVRDDPIVTQSLVLGPEDLLSGLGPSVRMSDLSHRVSSLRQKHPGLWKAEEEGFKNAPCGRWWTAGHRRPCRSRRRCWSWSAPRCCGSWCARGTARGT